MSATEAVGRLTDAAMTVREAQNLLPPSMQYDVERWKCNSLVEQIRLLCRHIEERQKRQDAAARSR